MSSRPATRPGANAVEPFTYQPAMDRMGEALPEPGAAEQVELEVARAEIAERVRQARQEGSAEAEKRLRTEYEETLAAMRAAIGKTIEEFARQREDYFESIEEEIVNLSLSIARKILHREAQIDPLLLAGLVHVALEKLGAGTHVRLRVNPAKLASWEEHFREMLTGAPAPEFVADAALGPEECALETGVGTTSIGLEAHLKEIEQGFFDLLAKRPR
ncbi:MAG: flagellar assembly protein FliH/Type III secretion system HrpE [Acidobacteriota bacterium]|nr:flagellar assembly protein FliH/Type III secretion system HrpE [Acidobacteriota bacterium]